MAERVTRCRPWLGTFVEVSGDSEEAVEAAFDAIARAHALMSAHEADSDIGRINRFGHMLAVTVDRWTIEVMERALFWSRLSSGIFDIAAAGASAIERGQLPLHPGQPVPDASSFDCIAVTGSRVRLARPACIDVGGIAKGYAVDRAVAAMRSAGAAYGLVNAGGDLAGFGPQPWPVQVVQPLSRTAVANVAVENGAIATSSIQPDGSDAHLLRRPSEIISATVCAPAAVDADALTKIVLAGSSAASNCLVAAEAQAFVISSSGEIRTVGKRGTAE